jgi:WhiB family redox-sensing transcriptional regulator
VSRDWMSEALCATTDPEAFFPDEFGSAAWAKKICGQCNVVEACLEYAMRTGQMYGVWGGLSPKDRQRMRRDAA